MVAMHPRKTTSALVFGVAYVSGYAMRKQALFKYAAPGKRCPSGSMQFRKDKAPTKFLPGLPRKEWPLTETRGPVFWGFGGPREKYFLQPSWSR